MYTLKIFIKICKKSLTFISHCDIIIMHLTHGGIAQLARAPALQAGGLRFESAYLHHYDALMYLLYQVLI